MPDNELLEYNPSSPRREDRELCLYYEELAYNVRRREIAAGVEPFSYLEKLFTQNSISELIVSGVLRNAEDEASRSN